MHVHKIVPDEPVSLGAVWLGTTSAISTIISYLHVQWNCATMNLLKNSRGEVDKPLALIRGHEFDRGSSSLLDETISRCPVSIWP